MKQGWEIKRLGDVCTSDLGKTLNQSKDTGDMHPYLCAINILWDKIDFTTVKQTRFESSEIDRYSVRKDDLLICEGGDIGRAAIWDKDETMLYQNALHRVRFYGSIIPKFCLLYLRFLKNTGVLDERYGKGVTIKHLVKSSLLSIPIPVPPIAEQEKIVAELDCLSGIIEKKKQQMKELDNLAQSIFYEMFGEHADGRDKWKIAKLGNVCKTTSGGTPSKGHPEYYEGGDIPWLRSGEVNKMNIHETELFITKEGLNNSSAKWFPKNTVVIAMYGATVGQVGILCNPMTTNQAICGIFPNETFTPVYLYHFLLSKKPEYLEIATGGAQANISQNIVRDTVVSCPPLTLQQDFASKIESIEKQKELISRSIKETETLFNSRMDYYFNR